MERFGNLLALFNPDNLYSRYESYYNILKQSGAAEREEQSMKMIHSFPILHINLIIQIYIHCLDKELTI